MAGWEPGAVDAWDELFIVWEGVLFGLPVFDPGRLELALVGLPPFEPARPETAGPEPLIAGAVAVDAAT